ncbi:uncharacterized protein [Aegilops tauschii subsp. strangulata]|uniref:uncharacterized protein n=1 Tax=Aegilops tauschii subsp. strangulata TaxID=200361 RepID=UPI003CC8B5D1
MSLVPYAGGAGSSLPQPVPMLTDENYMTWAIKVEANLDAAGLWEAAVVPEDAVAVVIAKKDKPARAYLLGALAEDLLLQVASKKTAVEVWASLKARFVSGDRVRAARLGTLRGEFELLLTLDGFADKLEAMSARFTGLGSTLEDAALVKKLLDSVPDCLYAAVAGIEKFSDVTTMPFEEALGRLKAFDERLRRRGQADGERADGMLMYTARQQGGARDDDDDDVRSVESGNEVNRQGRCYKCGERGHFKRECPLLRKAPAVERALLVDDGVKDAGLL